MTKQQENLRVLMVTPEVTSVPDEMGPASRTICARAGGLGDICAGQIKALSERGMEVHLALPNYRNVFKANTHRLPGIDIHGQKNELPANRIHLAQDRSFYYHPRLFQTASWENVRISLAFQREVINRIIPEVRPDLIHCYDWMTGLIPPLARSQGIPSIFTLYRLESPALPLAAIEERGIDAASFWQHCYYARMPSDYQESREANPVDLLTSGIFGANMAQALSGTFLAELLAGQHLPAGTPLQAGLCGKQKAHCLTAVAPAPDPSFNPAADRALMRPYKPESHAAGKLFNKLHLQEILNLRMSTDAPLCFWPTRLDSTRPGCRLIAGLLPRIMAKYAQSGLQMVFVADGDFLDHLRGIVHGLNAADRAAVCDFDARRYRLAYGAADFVLMPALHDPCALPCKIGQRYGALPIGYDAGAVHDCASHLEIAADRGSGFLFRYFDAEGFLWAMDQAMAFHHLPLEIRAANVARIMRESLWRFDHEQTTRGVVELYEKALGRSLARFKTQAAAASAHDMLAA